MTKPNKPYNDIDLLALMEEQIAEHERAITKLVIAREVVTALGWTQGGVRKPAEGGEVTRAVTTKPRPKRYVLMTRSRIIAAMKAIGEPTVPVRITKMIRSKHPELTEKVIWNALYNMRKTGVVLRDNDGRYSLPPAVPEAEVTNASEAA